MQNFTYYSPTKYIFGVDTHLKVGKEIKKLNKKSVLLVYSGSVKRTGLLDKVIDSLEKEGINYELYGKAFSNPTSDLVYEGIEKAKSIDVDFILAIGGGSPIDLAKSIAVGVYYDGDFLDFYSGKDIESAVDLGVILTIAASGSESSPNAVITNTKTMEKSAIESDYIRPKFAIMNPELTLSLSSFQTGCGVSDMFSHLLERYFTNTPNVDLTDRILEAIMKELTIIGPKAVKDMNDINSR